MVTVVVAAGGVQQREQQLREVEVAQAVDPEVGLIPACMQAWVGGWMGMHGWVGAKAMRMVDVRMDEASYIDD